MSGLSPKDNSESSNITTNSGDKQFDFTFICLWGGADLSLITRLGVGRTAFKTMVVVVTCDG